MGKKPGFAQAIYESQLTQMVLGLVIYGIYAIVLGLALIPSVWLLLTAWTASGMGASLQGIPGGAGPVSFGAVLLLALSAGVAVWIYFIWGSIIMAILIRLITLGMKPGRYPKVSFTTLRWLIQSGIQTLAMCSVLPYITVGYFTNLYYRIIGARIGKNVYIRATTVVDAYLLTLEDGVILGGNAELSCHIMEPNCLVLQPIRIGEGSLVGAGAYIAPGTTVGKHCIVGARCYIRQGVTIPDGSVYTVPAGMPMKEAMALEKAKAMAMVIKR